MSLHRQSHASKPVAGNHPGPRVDADPPPEPDTASRIHPPRHEVEVPPPDIAGAFGAGRYLRLRGYNAPAPEHWDYAIRQSFARGQAVAVEEMAGKAVTG